MENRINLSYYQMMIFKIKLDAMKKNNLNFNEEKLRIFFDYFDQKTQELAYRYPHFLFKFIILFKPYSLSLNMFRYLVFVTGINPLNKKHYDSFFPIIRQFEVDSLKMLISEDNNNQKNKIKTKNRWQIYIFMIISI